MTAAVQQLLEEFDHLTDSDKRELAAEVLRRTIMLEHPPLTEAEFVQLAESLFLELDREESKK